MNEHDAAAGALDEVVAALGAAVAAPPPADLRSRVLAGAAARPRASLDPVDPRALYAARCDAMRGLLELLSPREWSLPAHPYAWSVHGLVAHLLQIERYTAAVVGAGAPWPGDEPDHLATGAAALAAELDRDPAATAADWIATARTVERHLAADGWNPHAPAPLHGWPFSTSAALVARAFEIWTHADDVCRATGRPLLAPSPSEIRTMSSFSVAALPFLLDREHPRRALTPTRLVLTGDGGGTFDIGPAGAAEPSLLVADVIDYCRVVARRIAPAELASERRGDLVLLDDLLVAAGAFAV